MYDLESVEAREREARKILEKCALEMADVEYCLRLENIEPETHESLKRRMEHITDRMTDASKILKEANRLKSDPEFIAISG